MVPGGESASGSENPTTNQRMELRAALEAISTLERPLEIVSDSTYLVNCFRDGWWKGWLARGWVNSQRKPVANRDLWEPIVMAYQSGGINFKWVKGHSGDRWNDAADQLAVAEVEKLPKGASGPAKSDGLAPGYRILVTGQKPPELGGYEENLTSRHVRSELTRVIKAKREMHPDLVVVSGLGLGVETMAAEAAIEAGIALAVVLPFPLYESTWPAASQTVFRSLLERATSVSIRERKAPSDRRQAGAAIGRRDGWVAAAVDEAIVAWDGRDPLVERTLTKLRQSLGEEDVWVIDVP